MDPQHLAGSSICVLHIQPAEPRSRVTLFTGVYSEPQNKDAKWWGDTPPGYVGASFFHAQQYGNVDLVLGGNVMDDTGHLGLEPIVENGDTTLPISNPWQDEGGALKSEFGSTGISVTAVKRSME